MDEDLLTGPSLQRAVTRWMTQFGYTEAAPARHVDTHPGSHTFEGCGAIARATTRRAPVTRPVLEQLLVDADADGSDVDSDLLFFTPTGYTPAAVAYADRVGIALFTFEPGGSLAHANRAALTTILDAGEKRAAPSPAPRVTPQFEPDDRSDHGADSLTLEDWAVRRYVVEQRGRTGAGAFVAYLPFLTAALLAVPTSVMAAALRSGSDPGLTVGTVLVPALTAVVFFLWGLWRVKEHRRVTRSRLLDRELVASAPALAEALVAKAMAATGLRYPRDREDFVLLRNAVTALGGRDPFTASVTVWVVAARGRLPGSLGDWLRETSVAPDAS